MKNQLSSENLKSNAEPDSVKAKKIELKKEILEELQKSFNAETRVKIFAKYLDQYGLDPLISLFPVLGDAGSSGLASIYLLAEAKKAGLSKKSWLKIISLQSADFFIGAVPIAGDALDFVFKANKWSVKDFEKKTEQLIKKARKVGIVESEIAKITQSAEKIPHLINNEIKR